MAARMIDSHWTAFFDAHRGDARRCDAEAADYCRRLERLLPLDGSQRVLDFGCGDGRVGTRLAPRTRRYLFWDAAARVRDQAVARLAAIPQASLADLDDAALDSAVDVILVNSVLQYLGADDLRAWLVRWRDLLRPDGRIILSDLIVAPESFAAALRDTVAFLRAERMLLRGLPAGLGEIGDYARMRRRVPLAVVPIERLAEWAAAAGLHLRLQPENLTFRRTRRCAVLGRATPPSPAA